MQLVDTNVLIRHFTGDPPSQATRATAFLQKAEAQQLLLLDVHVAEAVYVLEGPYRQSPKSVALLMAAVMGLAAIKLEHPQRIARATTLYADAGLDFTDAYLIAAAEELGPADVVSFDRFDRKVSQVSAIRRREP